jgi:hypothetical protein
MLKRPKGWSRCEWAAIAPSIAKTDRAMRRRRHWHESKYVSEQVEGKLWFVLRGARAV